MRIVLQVAVAWIALDVVFGILWAWACQPTLAERIRQQREGGGG